MLIDWFTASAQLLNFLVLVWLMKRFLYRPILDAIDARERRLSEAQTEAETLQHEAATERDEYRRKNAEFDSQRQAMHDKATAEAEAELQHLLEQAREEASEMRSRLFTKLNGEYESLHDEITRGAQAEVVELTRKMLADLADTSLEQRILEVFEKKLLAMDSAERERLAQTLSDTKHTLVVRSAFPLADEQRDALGRTIQAVFGGRGGLQFEVVPGLVSGIELLLHGEKVAWSISSHMASFEKMLRKSLGS